MYAASAKPQPHKKEKFDITDIIKFTLHQLKPHCPAGVRLDYI